VTGEARATHIAQELEKGRHALRAGEELLKLGLFDDAVTRYYYAAFHFAAAALLVDGIEATSHRALRSLFSEHLIHTGRMSAARAKDLRRLQSFRESADYDRTFVFTREGAEEEAAVARAFVDEIERFLRASGFAG
jgi:uncharacterized protein (UPF0332 family)